MKRRISLAQRILVILVTVAMVTDVVPVSAMAEALENNATPVQVTQDAPAESPAPSQDEESTPSEAGNSEAQDQTPPASDATDNGTSNDGASDTAATDSNANDSEQQNSATEGTPNESNAETPNNGSDDANSGEGKDAEGEKEKDKEEKDKDAKDANERPAFSQKVEVDGTTVEVHAEAGVFPKDAKLKVNKVTEGEQREADAAVEQQREENQNVATSYTYDVRVEDKDGKEVQPPEGKKVEVSFTRPEVASNNLETHVYHMDEQGEKGAQNEQSGDTLVAEQLAVKEDGATAKAETTGFSLYTVEFTYDKKQYVMDGDSTVPLANILANVGLTGEVSAVEVSNSELFSAARDGAGAWQVTAHKPFITEEWMKVTIDGVTYEIVVTDAYTDEDTNIPLTGLFAARFGKYQVFDVQRSPAYPGGSQSSPSSFTVSSFKWPYNASAGTFFECPDTGYYFFRPVGPASKKNISYSSDWQSSSDGTIDPYIVNLYYNAGTSGAQNVLMSTGVLGGIADEGFFYEGNSHYGYYISNSKGYNTGSTSVSYTPMKNGRVVCSVDILTNYDAGSMLQPGEEKHTHDWSLTASGATATVKCTVANCSYGQNTGYTATISASNATYDGKNHGASVTKASGFPSEATVSDITYTGTTEAGSSYNSTTAPKAAGSYTATATVKAGSTTKTISKSYTISQQEIDVSWNAPTYTYNGKEQGPTATATGIVSGDSCTVTVMGKETNAGNYTATANSISNANYKLPATKPTKQYTINKANLTVTAKNKTITYGDEPANDGVTYNGWVNGEGTSALDGTLALSCEYVQYGDVGTYPIKPSGLTSNNYNITFKDGTLTVNKRAITVTAEDKSSEHNATVEQFTHTITNTNTGSTDGALVNGDTATVTFDCDVTSQSRVGEYPIVPQVTGSEKVLTNYAITYANGVYTVQRSGQLNVSASGWRGNYDGQTHGISVEASYPPGSSETGQLFVFYSLENFATMDGVDLAALEDDHDAESVGQLVTNLSSKDNVSTSSPTISNVDDSPRTVYYLVLGDNYYPVTGSRDIVINKVPLTVKANDKTITYGDAPANDGVTYTGFVNGETAETEGVIYGTLSFAYDYRQYGDVGTYTITPKGLSVRNYELVYEPGTLTVNPRSATLSWAGNSFAYNGSQQGPKVTVNTVNGDDVQPDGLTDNSTVLETEVGEYNATYTMLSGAKAQNYVLAEDEQSKSHSWSITKVQNTISKVEIEDWTYGEPANAPTCKAMWGADKAHYQYSSRPDDDDGFSDEVPTNAGTYYVKAIIDESEDYARAESVPVPFTIKKADIAIAAYDATIVYRDGLDVATLAENANLNQVPGKPLPYFVMGAYNASDDLGVTVSIETPPTGTFQVGTYPIKVHWNGNPNYNCDEGDLVDGDYHVTATEVSATAIGYDGTYDGQPHGINISLKEGASEDDVTVYYRERTSDSVPLTKDNYTEGSTTPVTRTDAGLTEVYWYIAPKGNEDQGIWGMKGIYILPAKLTATANDKDITYGDDAANEGVAYSGFVTGEDAGTAGLNTDDLAFSYDDYEAGSDVGTYKIVPSGVTAGNYEIKYVPGTLTVNPLAATLEWPPTTQFAYNGKSQGVTPTIKNLREGDNVEVNVENGVKTGVGEYYASAVGLSGTSAKNYTLGNQGEQWSITPASAEENAVTVSIIGWTYGAYDPQINAPKVSATWGAETATFSYSTEENGTYTADVPTNAGDYYVKATIPATENYRAATATQQFTITPAPLTIESQDTVIKYYTDNLNQGTINGKLASVVVTGLVAGDTNADLGIGQSVEAKDAYASNTSYTVTPSYDNTKPKAANYSITTKDGSVLLTNSSVTFSAKDYTGVYDGRAHGITVTLGNDSADAYVYYSSTQALNSSNYATDTTRNPNDASVTRTDVGETQIYFYVVPKGATEGVSGVRTVKITKAPLVVQPEDQAITYGEAPDAHARRDQNDNNKLSKYGLLYNIPAGMPDGVEITNDFGYTYNYEQYGDVGNGTFSILPTADTVTSTNFALTFVPGTLTVARKELTATWPEPPANEILYEGTEVSVQPTGLDGKAKNDDDVTVGKVTGNKATEIGTYTASALTITGAKADNYVLMPSTYEWKIIQNTNSWKENKTPSIEGWTYGGAPKTPASEAQFGANTARYYYRPADSENDEDWTLEVPKQAGNYTMRAVVDGTASYTGLDTKDTPDLLVTFTIQKASVKLVPENKTSKYGEDIVDLSCTTQPRLVSGDQIKVTLETKATSTSPVGQYEISVQSYEENPNYSVDSTTAKGTYTITKADLPITSEGYEGVYDDAPHGITVTHDDTLAEDDVTIYYSANELTLESFATEKEAGNVTTDPMDTRVTRQDVGETMVYFYVDSANYQGVPAYGHQTVKITPAPLTVTAKPKTITFGDEPANDGVSYEGFVGDDQEKGQVEGEATFAYDYERFGNVDEYTITPDGLTSANYAITYATGKLTVEPHAITLDMIKLDPAEFAHEGSKKSPAVKLTFTHEDGTTYELQEGRDYQVSGATEGTDINTYTLTVTGKGNFKDAQDQTWRITGGNETIVGEKTYGKGKVQVALDTPGGNLSQSGKPGGFTPELVWSLLTPEEQEAVRNGATCKVYLVMQELDKPALGDVAALSYAAMQSGTTPGMYFDVSLWKQIGNAPATRITSTGDQMISLEVGVPDKLKNAGANVKREFGVARAHEGVGEIVSDKKLTTNDPVPFSTNKFSGYALVYKDTTNNSNGNKSSNTGTSTARSSLAKTDDTTVSGMWIATLVVAGAAIIICSRKLRTR